MLLFLACSNLLIAQEEMLIVPETMPVFGPCDQKKADDISTCSNQNLVSFISENLTYPELATIQNIEGTVVISFTVSTDGSVVDPVVKRDIGGGCGDEALRLLNLMPKWKPALKEGQPTPMELTLPISFALNDSHSNADQNYRILWGSIGNLEEVTQEELFSNLISEVSVLDENGNRVPLNELLFSVTKKKRYQDASSTGGINVDMKRLVSKVKPKRIFSVIATVQVDGKFIFVEKDWEVVKSVK